MGVIGIGILSVIFALLKPGALADLLNLANSGVGVLVPTVIGGLYWKKATKQGAIISALVGEVMMITMTFILKVSPLGFSAGLWSMATSLVLYIVICNLTTAHKHTGEVIDSINKFFKED